MNVRLAGTLSALLAATVLGCSGAEPPSILLQLGGESSDRIDFSFGSVAAGERNERVFELVNRGSSTARVTGTHAIASNSNGAGRSAFAVEADFPLELAPGQAREIRVTFTPMRAAAAFSGSFRFELEQPGAEGPLLVLSGSTGPVKCTLALEQEALDFGTVSPVDPTTRSFTVRNASLLEGADCEIELRLDREGDPRFRIEAPMGSVPRLAPGDSLQVEVSLTPGEPAKPSAESGLSILADSELFARLPLTGAFPGCLEFAQGAIDFGAQSLCSPAEPHSLTFRNTCPTKVSIDAISVSRAAAIGVGHPSCPGPQVCPRFFLEEPVAVPLRLAEGEEVTVQLRFDPMVAGDAEGKLRILHRSGNQPIETELSLHGRGRYPGYTQTQNWSTGTRQYADVVVVVDNGASMGARQQELLPRFAELTQQLRYVCRDLNVVVTTADSRSGSTEGRFLQPAGQPMVLNSRATPAFTGLLQERLAVATDPAAPGTPLEAARLALSSPLIDNENAGFLRPVGDLWLVIATDRPDTSPQNVSEYLQAFAAVKPAASSRVFVAGGFGDVDQCGAQADDGRLEQASTATGGSTQGICDDSWHFSGVSGNCIPDWRYFGISDRAIAEDGFNVWVDGTPVPEKDANGATLWSYASNLNAIEFAQAPGENKQITITYHKASCAP